MPSFVAPTPPFAGLAWASPRAEESAKAPDALSTRALQGDIAAWNALIQKHNHRVVVALLGRGVGMERAKDLAQDAWIRLIEQQRQGKLSHLTLPGLAVTQATFLALEEARRVRRDKARTEDTDGHDVPHPGADAEARMLTEERLTKAEEVLASCSLSARKVFRLAYGGEGLSHADIAERVGLSLQRVRQILCEVRKLLRASAEDTDGAESSEEPTHGSP